MNDILRKYNRGIWLFCGLISLMVICCLAYKIILSADEREHLYCSYLVWRGEIPYRDFFEHHHPLLWYIFAPLLIFFHNTPWIWFIIRGFTIILLLITAYFVYKIARLIDDDKERALVSAVLYCSFYAVQYVAFSFRPDNLMLLLFVAGVYYFFCYVAYEKKRYLIGSYFLFLLSFLALQKILFMLIVMGGIVFFLPRLHKNLGLELKMLLLPILGFALFLGYWYYHGVLKDYFELNFILNMKIKIVAYERSPLVWGGNLLGLWFSYLLFKKANYYLKAVIILFLGTLCSLACYAHWLHYWFPIYPFLAIIITKGGERLFKNNYRWFWILLWFFENVFVMVNLYNYKLVNLSSFSQSTATVLNLTDEDDLIIGSDIWVGGLRKSALGYYWGVWTISQLDYKLFHRREWPDINLIIKTRHPRIVANYVFMSCLSEKNEQVDDYAFCHEVWSIDRQVLSKYWTSDLVYWYPNKGE